MFVLGTQCATSSGHDAKALSISVVSPSTKRYPRPCHGSSAQFKPKQRASQPRRPPGGDRTGVLAPRPYLSVRSLVAICLPPNRSLSHLFFTVAFGGPGVHVIILRRKFVDQLGWLNFKTFNDLFALGNALPGPGSTQLAFSIALVTNGTLAGILAFIMWS